QCTGSFLEIENLCPILITLPLSCGQFTLNINEKVNLFSVCYRDFRLAINFLFERFFRITCTQCSGTGKAFLSGSTKFKQSMCADFMCFFAHLRKKLLKAAAF